MKTVIQNLLFVLLLLFTSSLSHAQSTVTYSAERYWHSGCTPVYNPATGAITALNWDVRYQEHGSDGTDRESTKAPPLTPDLMQHLTDTVTVGQTTLTVQQILAALQIELNTLRAAQIAALAAPGP